MYCKKQNQATVKNPTLKIGPSTFSQSGLLSNPPTKKMLVGLNKKVSIGADTQEKGWVDVILLTSQSGMWSSFDPRYKGECFGLGAQLGGFEKFPDHGANAQQLETKKATTT